MAPCKHENETTPLSPMTESGLRAKIRRLMASGTLPRVLPAAQK
jgi:hypothetical protein